MPDETHTYRVPLTEQESEALAWIAARYESAGILWQHAQHAEDVSPKEAPSYPYVIMLPEHVAWDYLAVLADENGNPHQLVPPCVGGALSDKLLTLYVEIV